MTGAGAKHANIGQLQISASWQTCKFGHTQSLGANITLANANVARRKKSHKNLVFMKAQLKLTKQRKVDQDTVIVIVRCCYHYCYCYCY